MPCNDKGQHIRKECSRREDHGHSACKRYEDHGYSSCNTWDKKCCTWWPCSWACKVITWICRGWVWISNVVCVLWVWVANVVCVAYSWVVDGVCLTWHLVVGAFSGVLDGILCGAVSGVRRLFGARTPACDPERLFGELAKQKAEVVTWLDESIGVLTTPFKCLGIQGWTPTGCAARGSGVITRDVAWSTDGLYTIDVELDVLTIGGQTRSFPGPDGSHGFLRLEVRPFRAAWSYCNTHALGTGDAVEFAGPMFWDHNGKWLEVHPDTLRRGEHVGRVREALPPVRRELTPAASALLALGIVGLGVAVTRVVSGATAQRRPALTRRGAWSRAAGFLSHAG